MVLQFETKKKNKLNKLKLARFPVFSAYDDVVLSLHQGKINIFCFLWLRWETKFPVISSRKGPIESQIDCLGNSNIIYENSFVKKNKNGSYSNKYILTTAGRVIFNQQIQQSVQEHFCSFTTIN